MSETFKQEQLAGKLAEFEQISKVYDDVIKSNKPRLSVQGQGKLLLSLADNDGVSQRSLAQRLGMTPQSTGEFVRKLESRGLVSVSKSQKDRRITIVNLTDAGRKAVEDASQEIPPFLQPLSDDELDQLDHLISKLIDNMYSDIDAADPTLSVKFHKFFVNRYLEQTGRRDK